MNSQDKVQVVILCGGFGEGLVSDLLHEIETNEDIHQANRYHSMLKGEAGKWHVTEGLQQVHRGLSLYHLISCMRTSQRLLPLDQNVFIVCNDANKDSFVGGKMERASFIERVWSQGGLRIRKDHVVSNGTSSLSDWQGEGADLRVMVESGLLDPEAHLIVVRGSMLFVTNYGFSRLVEHPLVLGNTCVAYSKVEKPRAEIMQFSPHEPFILDFQDPEGSCGPVTAVDRGAPREGEFAAMGLAFLKASEVPSLLGASPDNASLEEIALQPWSEGRPVGGINLQWGHFSVGSLAELQYAGAVFESYEHDIKASRREAVSRDIESSLKFGDDHTLLGLQGDTLHEHARTHTPQARLQTFVQGANDLYFSRVGTPSTPPVPNPPMPPSFYLSQYRRSSMLTQHFLHAKPEEDLLALSQTRPSSTGL
eukprot:CAMPEP_0117663766 /NCGR_PEP_ID=MMETSP0804-20121206/8801_1 /TAXON_ID=1074897 /ORGANISM="Tetraselmis astigmatica, Strain CCMP880" /LENGTH=422 /DNA_ID=CAMNT_0005470833 /DNA_START=133 /DNA_END=1401 /DNA_ORIENTATION=+